MGRLQQEYLHLWNSVADAEAYIRRLCIFREIFGDNQTEISQRIGIEYKRWSNLERGYPMSRDLAWLLHKRLPGVSTDWFWFGKMDGLSAYYREQIPLAEKRMVLRERAELTKNGRSKKSPRPRHGAANAS